jgi:hypothetical protein
MVCFAGRVGGEYKLFLIRIEVPGVFRFSSIDFAVIKMKTADEPGFNRPVHDVCKMSP